MVHTCIHSYFNLSVYNGHLSTLAPATEAHPKLHVPIESNLRLHNGQLVAYESSLPNSLNYIAALPAAINFAAMASGKNIWHLKFWQKSPIGNQQIKRETYLKKIIIINGQI